MPDITMCEDDSCILKDKCYRYTAKITDRYQYWFIETPRNKETNECEEFWDNGKEKE